MPEGPEVARIAESLNNHFGGKQIISMTIDKASKYAKKPFEHMEAITFGLKINNVKAIGKRILFNVTDLKGNNFKLMSFLGMEGHWVKMPTKYKRFTFEIGDITFINGVTNYSITKTMYYEDMLNYGNFRVIINDEEYKDTFKAVGPDLLHDYIPFESYSKVIKSSRIKNKEVADFILEQKYFSGIGNYLKSDILYAARIAPNRILSTLRDEDIRSLYDLSISIIKISYDKYGYSLRSYVDPDGNMGTYSPLVYGRENDDMGHNIIKEKFKDNRGTYWVPEVQK
jgi:DNA-formamidopyrimidine glycosylase